MMRVCMSLIRSILFSTLKPNKEALLNTWSERLGELTSSKAILNSPPDSLLNNIRPLKLSQKLPNSSINKDIKKIEIFVIMDQINTLASSFKDYNHQRFITEQIIGKQLNTEICIISNENFRC